MAPKTYLTTNQEKIKIEKRRNPSLYFEPKSRTQRHIILNLIFKETKSKRRKIKKYCSHQKKNQAEKALHTHRVNYSSDFKPKSRITEEKNTKEVQPQNLKKQKKNQELQRRKQTKENSKKKVKNYSITL